MNRLLVFAAAVLCSLLSLSTASAIDLDRLRFTLEPQRDGELMQVRFSSSERPGQDNWSTGFRPRDLIGLDVVGFRSVGSRPIAFAVDRDAGRLDCAGTGGGSYASGNCRFSAKPQFTELLVSRGIGRPDAKDAFALMAVDARRELIDTLAAERYAMPSVDNLIALAALGVSSDYIRGMAAAGYRPRTINNLIEFKALNITPQWIAGFARMGYANLPADQLVQLKALNITPEYIAEFARAGYPNLPVDTLVQLKALDVTPEFVRAAAGGDGAIPSVGKLAQLKKYARRR